MPVIVCPVAPRVKSLLASLPVPAVADAALSARLLAVEPMADTPAVDGAFEPTLADRWALIGSALGRAGSLPTAAETFPDATPAERIDGAFWFAEACHAGYASYVRSIGKSLALDGRECEKPLTIPDRYATDFIAGWETGDSERSERVRLEALWSAEYDAETDARAWEGSSAEAMGWPARPGIGHAA